MANFAISFLDLVGRSLICCRIGGLSPNGIKTSEESEERIKMPKTKVDRPAPHPIPILA